jgi:tRNA dimethylallyltransferase
VRVIAIFGPTASGKTDVAEAVADRIDAELVSADAMQVYEGLPILTNQSPRPTRLVAIWPLNHEASIAEFQRLAHEAIDEILSRSSTPIVVGGTGLYLRAALARLDLPPAPPSGLRDRVDAAYERLGPARAHALLAEHDPQAAARVHANDRRRVVRALELVELGRSLAPAQDRLWTSDTRHPTTIFGLDVPREELIKRIEARTASMLERGVEDEVRNAASRPMSSTARGIHGLADFAELPRDEAVKAYNQRLRRYAAYQRKWMRRVPGLIPIDGARPPADIAAELVARIGGDALLRRARPEDAEGAFQVQRAASLAALGHIYPPDRYAFPDAAVRERWEEAVTDASGDVLVAERGNRIVGVAAAKQGWLDGLYVLPDEWGNGVAGLLHDAALERLAAAGASSARLWVLEDNTRARRFYERRGWRQDGSERIVPFPPHPLDVGYTKELRWSAGARSATST